MAKRTASPEHGSRTLPRYTPADETAIEVAATAHLNARGNLPPDPECESLLARTDLQTFQKAQWMLQNARIPRLAQFLGESGPVEVSISNLHEAANLASLTRRLTNDQANTAKLGVSVGIDTGSRGLTDMLADAIRNRPGIFRSFTLSAAVSPRATANANASFLDALRQLGQLHDDLGFGLALTNLTLDDATQMDALARLLPRCATLRILAANHPQACWGQLGHIVDAGRIENLCIHVAGVGAAPADGLGSLIENFQGLKRIEINVDGPGQSATAWTAALNSLPLLTTIRLGGRIPAVSLGLILEDGGLPHVRELAYYSYGDFANPGVATFTRQLLVAAPRLHRLELVIPVVLDLFLAGIQDNTSLHTLAMAPVAQAHGDGRPDLRETYEAFKANRTVTDFRCTEYSGSVISPLVFLTLEETLPFVNIANRNRLQFQSEGFAVGAWRGLNELTPTRHVAAWVPDPIVQNIMDIAGREAAVTLSSVAHGVRDAATSRGVSRAAAGGDNALDYVLGTRLAWRGGRNDPAFAQLIEMGLGTFASNVQAAVRHAQALPALLDSLPNRTHESDGRPTLARKLLDALTSCDAITKQDALDAMHIANFSPEDQGAWLSEELYFANIVPKNGHSPQLQSWMNALLYMLHTGRPWPTRLGPLQTQDIPFAVTGTCDVLGDGTAEAAHRVLRVLKSHVAQPQVIVRYAAGAVAFGNLTAGEAAHYLRDLHLGAEVFVDVTRMGDQEDGDQLARLMRLLDFSFLDRACVLSQSWHGRISNASELLRDELGALLSPPHTAAVRLSDPAMASRLGIENLANLTSLALQANILIMPEVRSIADSLDLGHQTDFLLEIISAMR